MTARAPRYGQRGRGVSRYAPVGLFALALASLVALLPTALRPPQQPPNQSAQLSPDAPPDESQESIVDALRLGESATAGGGPDDGTEPGGAEVGGPSLPAPAPPPVQVPRFCPQGVGEPPRQVESFYSAPCAAPWQGDNGGATWKGVTATEVRVGSIGDGTADNLPVDDDEPKVITDEPLPDESANYRTWRTYQNYFNQNFQLWGRHLRFVVTNSGQDDEAQVRAQVQAMDEHYRAFAVKAVFQPALAEAARRRLVGFGGWNWGEALYRNNEPYLASWRPDGSLLMRLSAEYLCKRLVGRPADFAGAGVQGRPRQFGLITTEYAQWGKSAGFELPALVEKECGARMVVQHFGLDDANSQQRLATAVAQFRAQDVTTVVLDVDPFFAPSFLSQADSQSYFPEWFVAGTFSLDDSRFPIKWQFSRTQWSHAFGISGSVMAHRRGDADYYRAYKSVDPGGTSSDVESRVFSELLQIVNGIQMAGPILTPETFRQGLLTMGARANEPPWSIGGGYGPDDFSYADDVAEIWWDVTAPNPFSNEQPGSYRYTGCGRRYRAGQIPAGPPPVFDADGTCTVAPGQA